MAEKKACVVVFVFNDCDSVTVDETESGKYLVVPATGSLRSIGLFSDPALQVLANLSALSSRSEPPGARR